MPTEYEICYCDRGVGPHVHVPKTDDHGQLVGAIWDEPETKNEELERRVGACEANLANVWEVLNARNADDG